MRRYADWSDLFTHILDGSHGFCPQSAVRCVQIIGQLHRTSQSDYEVARNQILIAVIRDPRAALGQASCWPLGDVIIALQVPAGAALWTLDKDFAPLAQTLDLPLYHNLK